jgi:hypothetical protein
MAVPGAFLLGATSRLLPASIPLRFFAAAALFHLLAWLALLAGAERVLPFVAAPGWPLAALHLATLGVLVMTAIGAGLQLLPIATRQPVPSTFWPRAIWWLYAPGVAVLALGMGLAQPRLLGVGALAVLLALLAFTLLLALNLWHARGMPDVVAHGWGALACLLVVLVTALALVLGWLGVPTIARATALALHLAFATYGFMGLLALGLSCVLVPMFALAAAPDRRRSIASCALAAAALALAAVAAFGIAPQPLRVVAIVLGAGAVALHLQLMRTALAKIGRAHV